MIDNYDNWRGNDEEQADGSKYEVLYLWKGNTVTK